MLHFFHQYLTYFLARDDYARWSRTMANIRTTDFDKVQLVNGGDKKLTVDFTGNEDTAKRVISELDKEKFLPASQRLPI